MNINFQSIVVLLLVAFTGQGAFAQLATIPEQLTRAGSPLSDGATVAAGPPPSLDEILKQTDIIVRGFAGPANSYLSKDAMQIFTDYQIVNPMVLYRSTVDSSRVPGVPTVTATLLGGKVVIDGLSFTSVPMALPRLNPGAEYLLLLKQVDGKNYIAGTYFGAFLIAGGRLTPSTGKVDFAPEYRDVPADGAVLEMMDRRASLR